MTCVVSVVDKRGTIYMGGDSAGVAGLNITVRKDPKVFIVGDFIYGICGSFRMRDLLLYSFVAPKIPKNKDLNDYMRTDFIDELIKTFEYKGFSRREDNVHEMDGAFLVGSQGRLFNIEADFQVGEANHSYDAAGCGADIANGSLFSTQEFQLTPQERIELALEAAVYHNGGVRPPYTIMKLSSNHGKK